jgi:hypothetical protein
MTTEAQLEAQLTRPDGTAIVLRGHRKLVTEALLAISPNAEQSPHSADKRPGNQPRESIGGGLASVAEIDEGVLNLIVTDLKASTQADATKRLIYIALLARRQLLNEKRTARSELRKHLQAYNLDNGNTRNLIANDNALIKEGTKYISLAGPAIPIAQSYVKDVNDPETKGRWTLSMRTRRRRNGRRESDAERG